MLKAGETVALRDLAEAALDQPQPTRALRMALNTYLTLVNHPYAERCDT